jgi:signal transduction histidine kinase
MLFILESVLLFVIVFWPGLQRRLGPWFLPITLGWLLLSPYIQQLVAILAIPADFMGRGGKNAFYGVGIESVWLLVPVVLATWQYGRRGWRVSLGLLVLAEAVLVLLALLVSNDMDFLAHTFLGAIAAVTMIGLIGWVVLKLVESLRAERDALIEANRQLGQRAATIEQLTESRERNRLARELHDTLAHSLTGVSVQLQALGTLMQHDQPEAAQAQLLETQATVRSGIKESRRSIEALRASPLEDVGLSEALRQLCRKNAERTGIVFECEIDEVKALDPLTEQAIYRVAESALTNVVQHAAASEVCVRLMAGPSLCLEIQDNGVGFDLGTVPDDRYGLTGMAERAELVGATLTFESEPGRGTKVRMEIGKAG